MALPDSSNRDQEPGTARKLHLRLAGSVADLEYLRPVSVEFHEESRFGDIPYSHKKRDDLFMNALRDRARYALMIAELGGRPGWLPLLFDGRVPGRLPRPDHDGVLVLRAAEISEHDGRWQGRCPASVRCGAVVRSPRSAGDHDPCHLGYRRPANRPFSPSREVRRHRSELFAPAGATRGRPRSDAARQERVARVGACPDAAAAPARGTTSRNRRRGPPCVPCAQQGSGYPGRGAGPSGRPAACRWRTTPLSTGTMPRRHCRISARAASPATARISPVLSTLGSSRHSSTGSGPAIGRAWPC